MKLQLKFFIDIEEGPVPKAPAVNICPYAAQFKVWADLLCAEHTRTIVTINQAKVLLLDKAYEWASCVPNGKHGAPTERNHICIASIFDTAYRFLRAAELGHTPPMLFLPPKTRMPKPPPPAPEVKLPESLERLLHEYAVNEILGEEP